ncbi:nuclear transport factor 2 family protein [bacterium]|nr:nuclear transport factor 2 family protein [bacterium]
MDFIDSFSSLHEVPLASLVTDFYHCLNDFVAGKNNKFLKLWHEGPESVLYFNLDERERGGENIRRCFQEIQGVLLRAPVRVSVTPLQLVFYQSQDLAYAVIMEKSQAQSPSRPVLDEHRSTIVWRLFKKSWKVVHYHADTYTRRHEALSELLRSYHRQG